MSIYCSLHQYHSHRDYCIHCEYDLSRPGILPIPIDPIVFEDNSEQSWMKWDRAVSRMDTLEILRTEEEKKFGFDPVKGIVK